MDSIFGLMT